MSRKYTESSFADEVWCSIDAMLTDEQREHIGLRRGQAVAQWIVRLCSAAVGECYGQAVKDGCLAEATRLSKGRK